MNRGMEGCSKKTFRISERFYDAPCKHNPGVILCSIGLIAVCLAAACSSVPDDAARIRQMIDDTAQSAEAHDIAAILDHTTDEFSANPGGHDRRSIRGVLWWAFKHYGEFNILFPKPRVALADSGQRADAAVIFVIVKKGGIVPDLDGLYDDPRKWVEELGAAADLYRLDLSLVKTGGQWRVSTADLSSYR